MRILLLELFVVALFCHESVGQELKLKRKKTEQYIEEYSVLKDDKKIMHGQYVRYFITRFGHTVLNTVGVYNRGMKSDQWFYFSSHGYLENEGQFMNDEKEGLWIEYYEPGRRDTNVLQAVNSAFAVNKGIVIKDNGEIEIDRSVIVKSAEGHYLKGQKIGVWQYYGRDGELIHKYDHASGLILVDNSKVYCPFLGGFTRFRYHFNKFIEEIPQQNSKVVLKVPLSHSAQEIEATEWTGDSRFAEKMRNVLTMLVKDFIAGEVTVTISATRKEDFMGFGFEFGKRNNNE